MMNFKHNMGQRFQQMHGGGRRGGRGAGLGPDSGEGPRDPENRGRRGGGFAESSGRGRGEGGPGAGFGGGRRGGGSADGSGRGRRDGGFGGGRRGGGFADGFGGGRIGGGMMRGRKLSAAELQLVLLALLETQPAHGYELIRQLEERSGGFYAPSPGMVYPALTYLDDVGEALASADGQRKLYTITEAGRERLAAHREQVEAILAVLARIGSRMGEVREAFAGEEGGALEGNEDLRAIRQALRQALMRKRGCSAEEANRIAGILRRAIEEIGSAGG
ncbi:PadR family transcriptional regulator [Frateuria aurantia]